MINLLIKMMKTASFLNKLIALLFFVLSIILCIYYDKFVPQLTDFTEQYIQTSTGVILDNQVFILELTVIFFIILCLLISVILLFNLHKKFFRFIKSILDTNKIKNTFFVDHRISSKTYPKRVFIFTLVFALIMHLKLLLTGDPKEETILEHLNSLMFFFSAFILGMALLKMKGFIAPKKDRRIVKNWILVCILGLSFIFLEEISYGQHFFEWEASGVFKDNNFQSETNLHNFINPLFRFLYPASGIGLFTVLYLLWFYYQGDKPIWLELLTPHKSLFVLVFFMACASYIGHTETFEEMLSLLTLLYSIRIYLWLKKLHPLRNTNT